MNIEQLLNKLKTLIYSKSEVDTRLNDYIPKSGGGVSGNIDFDSTWDYTRTNQGWFPASINYINSTNNQQLGFIGIYDDSSRSFRFFLTDHSGNEKNILSFGIDSNNNTFITGYNNNAIAKYDDVVPRNGGPVLTALDLSRIDDKGYIELNGGSHWNCGASISLRAKNCNAFGDAGWFYIQAVDETNNKRFCGRPDGTLTWNGQSIQITSDQRLKQQISNIDDKLLDAWEDVEPVQFKYNDAVDQKGDTARLHTGYVVQQIDEACKSHNLDISAYGLYCHEVYSEETEEVEVEQEDGTKIKERKVIREASEHYSLRYTETLVVECAYLRREVSRLKQQNENLEQRLKMLENK